MKPRLQSRFAFIGKSMLWSLLLYIVMMLAINWEEISNTVRGRNAITVVTSPFPESQGVNSPVTPASISGRTDVITNILTLIKTISGFSTHSSAQ